jgi:lipopolysaccharide/colanic/teichoic acid biosynthesis glycosyltransferase
MAPLLAGVLLAIRLCEGGPALARQTRIGKDGQPFGLYVFKIPRHPKLAWLARLLRRWSVGEVLQLINVLRGEMSLVGPRAVLPDEAIKHWADVRYRLLIKPGLTGLSQVTNRSDLSPYDVTRLDIRYLYNWSVILDLQIIWVAFRTALGWRRH